MVHPLDDARLTIDRAQEHLAEIKVEIARYLDTRPYVFPTERDGDVLTARPAIIKHEPPHRLRSIIGDVLGNVRPILDYVAWQLACRHSPTPVVSGQHKIYFPISKDGLRPTKGLKELEDKYSVPPPATALIESVQPYHFGYESLGILNALVNEHKHCFPVLTVAYADTTSIDLTVEGPPLGTCVMHPPGSKAIVMGHNVFSMSVRRLTVEDLGPDGMPDPSKLCNRPTPPDEIALQQPTTIKVDGEVSVFVAIQHASVPLIPVERTLEQIVNCVRDIVPKFDAFV